jgi:hypothetical protein
VSILISNPEAVYELQVALNDISRRIQKEGFGRQKLSL